MAKRPYIDLYVGDWLRDSVAGCSLTAQGLWLRMMFLMHDSDRPGYLCHNGVPIPPESIARRCGCTLEQYTTLIAELDQASVPSRTSEGIIYSRRMVRDAKKRANEALRQAKHRRNGAVTPTSRQSHSGSEDSDSDSEVAFAVGVEMETEHEQNSRARFVPPSVEEVEAYCKSRKNHVDFQQFVDFYTANGWVQGKAGKPLKDWKAAVRTWEKNDFHRSAGRPGKDYSIAELPEDWTP